MPAVLDLEGIPTCCGYRLQPHEPTTQCGFCLKQYDTDELRRFMIQQRCLTVPTDRGNDAE